MLEATVLKSTHHIGWPNVAEPLIVARPEQAEGSPLLSPEEGLNALERRIVQGLMEESDELADGLVHVHKIL